METNDVVIDQPKWDNPKKSVIALLANNDGNWRIAASQVNTVCHRVAGGYVLGEIIHSDSA